MAPPTDAADPAPSTKHKKKKKSKEAQGNAAEKETAVTVVTANQNTDTVKPGALPGSDGVKKKKKKKKEKEQRTDSTVTPTVPPVSMTTETKQKGGKRKRAGEGPNVTPPTKKNKKEKQRKSRSSDGFDDFEDMDSPDCSVSERDLTELEEYIPDVRTKAKDVIFKMKRYDLPRLREFKRQGLKLRWGKYTYQENLQIRRNVADFLKLTAIESVDELFFPSRYPDRELRLKALRSQHSFYSRLADGLLRTCEQVYIRGRKIFDNRNNRGRFSEEENWQLQKLHTLHGNDWKTIGNKLDRSVYACEKRWNQMGEKNGPWTPEEEQNFYRVVKKYLKRQLRTTPSPGPGPGPTWVQLCSRLPWTKIGLKVQTRTWLQCRLKWFSYLRSRLKAVRPKEIQESPLQTRIRLIQTLNELQVQEVFDVDWVEIAKSVGGVTPICVQKIFHRMKVSRVPGWTTMSFGEIVDVLVEKVLPELQKRLDSPDPGPGPGPDPDRLNLDQIFPKDLDKFRELDNS